MKISAIKTKKIVVGDGLFDVLDEVIKSLKERSVVVVTSKIVSICEGNVVKLPDFEEERKKLKEKLVAEQSELYLPHSTKYKISFSIKRNMLIASAGIDESNGNGYLILWPKDPQKSANEIRVYLKKRFKLQNVGVIIVDSKTTPLRWGVTGITLAHSGFEALNDYTGKPDIFGREFRFEKVNVADGLAAGAVVAMGEGAEQTPIAVIENAPFVKFQNRNPSKKELEELHIDIDDDLYGEILRGVRWKKGKGK